MNIQGFENYIDIDSSRFNTPTLEALNYYAERYMLTVPFENIDVQNGVPISVDLDHLYSKIVEHQRGGFCYEMNTIFRAYLLEQGFDAQIMSATIHKPDGNLVKEGSHVTLVVTIDDVYYVSDVGYGDLPLHAIPITLPDESHPIDDVSGQFRAIFKDKDQTKFYVQKLKDDEWVTMYEAIFENREIHDFDDMIDYNQYSPDSIFVKQVLVTQPQSFGRATMSTDHLTLSKQSGKEKYDVTPENYRHYLKNYFNLDVEVKPLEQ